MSFFILYGFVWLRVIVCVRTTTDIKFYRCCIHKKRTDQKEACVSSKINSQKIVDRTFILKILYENDSGCRRSSHPQKNQISEKKNVFKPLSRDIGHYKSFDDFINRPDPKQIGIASDQDERLPSWIGEDKRHSTHYRRNSKEEDDRTPKKSFEHVKNSSLMMILEDYLQEDSQELESPLGKWIAPLQHVMTFRINNELTSLQQSRREHDVRSSLILARKTCCTSCRFATENEMRRRGCDASCPPLQFCIRSRSNLDCYVGPFIFVERTAQERFRGLCFVWNAREGSEEWAGLTWILTHYRTLHQGQRRMKRIGDVEYWFTCGRDSGRGALHCQYPPRRERITLLTLW